MNYCSQCASPLVLKIPEGDSVPRYVCMTCNSIHYQNPKIIVGCIATHEDKVLLCKRAIQPRYGLWTLPAGFMENGETVKQGALRETYEEAGANVELDSLFAVFSIPHISQVYMLFRGTLSNMKYAAGTESLDVELFDESAVPWEQLAFPVVTIALQYYFADYKKGNFSLHTSDIIR